MRLGKGLLSAIWEAGRTAVRPYGSGSAVPVFGRPGLPGGGDGIGLFGYTVFGSVNIVRINPLVGANRLLILMKSSGSGLLLRRDGRVNGMSRGF